MASHAASVGANYSVSRRGFALSPPYSILARQDGASGPAYNGVAKYTSRRKVDRFWASMGGTALFGAKLMLATITKILITMAASHRRKIVMTWLRKLVIVSQRVDATCQLVA